ncbi:MAG: hypothetical protein M3N93_11505 [Acidobacteriota bacterium]|nr:hypothetical protein [Acidobacteriota bacterium]
MWLFLAATVSAVILAFVVWRAAITRHRKRQNRSMRDHLNRITRVSE